MQRKCMPGELRGCQTEDKAPALSGRRAPVLRPTTSSRQRIPNTRQAIDPSRNKK